LKKKTQKTLLFYKKVKKVKKVEKSRKKYFQQLLMYKGFKVDAQPDMQQGVRTHIRKACQ